MRVECPQGNFLHWLPCLGLLGGIVCAFYGPGPSNLWIAIFVPATGLGLACGLCRKAPRLTLVWLCPLAFVLAYQITATELSSHCKTLPTAADLNKSYQIRARVHNSWQTRYGHALAVDRIQILSPGSTHFKVKRLTLYLPEMSVLPARNRHVTAWIRLKRQWQPHPIPWPMQRLRERFMPRFSGSVKHEALIAFDHAEKTIRNGLNQGNRELLSAFLEGRPSRLWRDRLAPFGLGHLLAISGLHCIFVFSGLQLLLLPLRRPLPRILLTALGLAAFAHWVGWSASVTRACLMLITWQLLPACHRHRSWLRLWCGLLLLGLLTEPLLFLQRGFWYSFGASLGLILGAGGKRPGPLDHPWLKRLRPLLPIVAAQLFVVPINLLFDCHTRFSSLFWNLLGLAMLMLLALLLVGAITAWLLPVLAPLANGCEKAIAALLQAFDWNNTSLELHRFPFPPGMVLLILLGMILALYFGRGERRWYLAITVLILGLCAHRPLAGPGTFMIDVGQGLCMLITDERGDGFLLDAGGRLPSGLEARNLLRLLGAKRVSGVAVSHLNRDHYNFIESLPAGTPIYLPSSQVDQLPKDAGWAGANIKPLSDGAYLPIRPEAEVIWPPAGLPTPNLNEASLTVLIRAEQWTLLFTGDAGLWMERRLVLPEVAGRRILQVGHHGSRSATGDDLIANFQPHIGLISCGFNNPFNHPHETVTARLREAGVQTFITYHKGTLEITAEGDVRPLSGYAPNHDPKR